MGGGSLGAGGRVGGGGGICNSLFMSSSTYMITIDLWIIMQSRTNSKMLKTKNGQKMDDPFFAAVNLIATLSPNYKKHSGAGQILRAIYALEQLTNLTLILYV